jgi:hypothetical protein
MFAFKFTFSVVSPKANLAIFCAAKAVLAKACNCEGISSFLF